MQRYLLLTLLGSATLLQIPQNAYFAYYYAHFFTYLRQRLCRLACDSLTTIVACPL